MKIKQEAFKIILILLALSLAGCGTKGDKTASTMDMDPNLSRIQNLEEELVQSQNEISLKSQELAELNSQLDTERERASNLSQELGIKDQKIMSLRQGPERSMRGADESLFPPNAKPGECFARVFVPNQYRRVTEKVLKKEAGEMIEVIPARYETVTERVLIEEASERLEVVPAKYGWVEEKIMVEPEKTVLVQVPAEFETVTEKILVRPAHIEWKKGTGPIQKIDNITGEIMCLVEEPAIYKTVSKKVLKSPARTKEVTQPAVFKTVKKQVMTKPPTTRVVEIPAKYKNIQVARMVSPAREEIIPLPAQYQTVTKKEIVSEAHMEWVPILCETNLNRSNLSKIQHALKSAGFDPGPIDGIIGRLTMQAVNEFQRSKGLLVTSNLTIETMQALGVSAR